MKQKKLYPISALKYQINEYNPLYTLYLLSEDPDTYPDALTKEICCILQHLDNDDSNKDDNGHSHSCSVDDDDNEYINNDCNDDDGADYYDNSNNKSYPYPRGIKIRTGCIGSIQIVTTVTTHTLLERSGE